MQFPSVLFALTLLASSSLLFFLQPMCAKMILPEMGGTPSVWNTCMVFFQAGLLAGYAYAHAGPRLLGTVGHGALHLLGLGLGFLVLPIRVAGEFPSSHYPVLWLLGTLTLAAGLPFLLISATAPLLQKWFSRTGRDPYFLYAASNFGSFMAMALYPLVVEPALSLGEQSRLWRWGYGLLMVLSFMCFIRLIPWKRSWGSLEAERFQSGVARKMLTGRRRLQWVLTALVPSSLMLSVTTHLTADIAPIPMLWAVPLSLYLLTFTLVFARRRLIPHAVAVRWMPLAVLVLAFLYLSEATVPILLILGLHVVGFFWIALVSHGELSRTRPGPEHLTEFYLWLAVGGVLGGIFNALIAPLVFSSLLEYPLMLAAASLLRPGQAELRGETRPMPNSADWVWPVVIGGFVVVAIFGFRAAQTWFIIPSETLTAGLIFAAPLLAFYVFQEHVWRSGFTLAAVLLASTFHSGVYGESAYQFRDFFGVHRVTEKDGRRMLIHGNTIHGLQIIGSPKPQGYYAGRIGNLLTKLQGDSRLDRVGVIGLGTGSMAFYANPGQNWTFFEIDPAVIHIAKDSGLFTFLPDAQKAGVHIDLIQGDGRASLRRHKEKFGMVAIDAFGSDSIPVHLLTREALEVYLDHLEERGLIVVHISNRYLDLEPVMANLALDHDPPLTCQVVVDTSADHSSVWVVMARKMADLPPIAQNWPQANARPDIQVWTDDFSNLIQVLRFSEP